MEEKRSLISVQEQDQVARALLAWLNQYPEKPVRRIEFECLPADKSGMALSTITAGYKLAEYITGGYDAQYQFSILYRVLPETSGDRLDAAERLGRLGRWAEQRADLPPLGAGKVATKVERSSPAALAARYEDDSEDYQILMQLLYEVSP